MEQDWKINEVAVYFRQIAEELGMKSQLVRTTNGLLRGGIDTMEKLCAMDDEGLKRVRNMGEKSISFALMARDKYQAESIMGKCV